MVCLQCVIVVFHFGCVSLAPKRRMPLPFPRLWLTPITWPEMGSKPQKGHQFFFVVQTVRRRNRPCRFHALVEIRWDRYTPIMRLSGEPPRDRNQSSAQPVIDAQQHCHRPEAFYQIMTCLIWALWVHVTYLFTKYVTESCDSPARIGWFNIDYQARHHVSLKRFQWKCHAENVFKNVLVQTRWSVYGWIP